MLDRSRRASGKVFFFLTLRVQKTHVRHYYTISTSASRYIRLPLRRNSSSISYRDIQYRSLPTDVYHDLEFFSLFYFIFYCWLRGRKTLQYVHVYVRCTRLSLPIYPLAYTEGYGEHVDRMWKKNCGNTYRDRCIIFSASP